MPHGGQCAIPFFPFSFNFLCNLLVIIFFHLLQNLKQSTCFDFYEYVGFFLFPLLIFNKNIELKQLCLKSSIACASGKENRFRLIAQPRNIEYNINNEASSLTMNSRENQKGIGTKKEVDLNNSSKTTTTTSSSRQWSCHKNPRIVRVSRTFGGKDRHSKVCTVRGLRDRRIRLSVPTAIQVYDLQDRLGLNQPSKVIDWLLDATDQEIDKLPPLPMLPLFHQPPNNPQSSSKNSGLNNPAKDQGDIATAVSQQDEQENQEGFGGFVAQLSAQNLFPLNNSVQSSSFANFPYNPYSFHWDHGYGYPMPNQADQDHSQLYFCPSAANMPPIIPSFPSYFAPSMDSDWRQMQNLQQNPLLPTTLNLISSPMKSFSLNVNSKSGHLQQNGNERREKDKRS